jgi:nitrous oxide reductase accessory protein NosL
MGEALVPYSDPKDAQSFVKDHGGNIFKSENITMDMFSPAKKTLSSANAKIKNSFPG